MNERSLVDLGQRFTNGSQIALRRVGFLATYDGKLFIRRRAGGTCTLRVAWGVGQDMSDRWSADLERPAGITCPAQHQRARPEAAA